MAVSEYLARMLGSKAVSASKVIVAAPDKFRGSASASEVAHAIAAIALASRQAGWECKEVPLADGGEGTLDVLGGANRTT